MNLKELNKIYKAYINLYINQEPSIVNIIKKNKINLANHDIDFIEYNWEDSFTLKDIESSLHKLGSYYNPIFDFNFDKSKIITDALIKNLPESQIIDSNDKELKIDKIFKALTLLDKKNDDEKLFLLTNEEQAINLLKSSPDIFDENNKILGHLRFFIEGSSFLPNSDTALIFSNKSTIFKINKNIEACIKLYDSESEEFIAKATISFGAKRIDDNKVAIINFNK